MSNYRLAFIASFSPTRLLTDKDHLAGFLIRIHNEVIAVQYFAVQNFSANGSCTNFLDGPL